MTMVEKFAQGLEKEGITIDAHETSFEVYKETPEFDVWIGEVFWDIVEYEEDENGKLYNIVVRFWMNNDEGDEICSAYSVEDMIKKIAEITNK